MRCWEMVSRCGCLANYSIEDVMDICPISGEACSREKNFKLDEIVDGSHTPLNLCSGCANAYFNDKHLVSAPKEDKKCSCGSSLADIAKLAKLGCPKCLTTFGIMALAVIDKAQTETPVAKVDRIVAEKKNSLETFKKDLEVKLTQAIAAERYEDAAKFRDQLKTAKAICKEKDDLNKQLDEAVANGELQKAAEIKVFLVALAEGYLSQVTLASDPQPSATAARNSSQPSSLPQIADPTRLRAKFR